MEALSRFEGDEGSSLFSCGEVVGVVVRCRRVMEEKSPDFRSAEVGISGNIVIVPRVFVLKSFVVSV